MFSCSTAQDVEDVSDDEFETASDKLMMKLMMKNGKMKMENLTKLKKKTGVMLKNERK